MHAAKDNRLHGATLSQCQGQSVFGSSGGGLLEDRAPTQSLYNRSSGNRLCAGLHSRAARIYRLTARHLPPTLLSCPVKEVERD